jgi:hypothetical protein
LEFIKSKERKLQRDHGGHRWSLQAEGEYYPSQVLLKLMLIYGKGGIR